ncbi:hypothetical protein [Flavobacterium kingsejongi]|uniref:Uncharacterized protein n=1 Tax=Flavobacterium kingsejongi TaxID=1678728 RepID=A0A2S1LS30_9FLAO|nr:hypothetical protein [Flavobacterium kingsejongi]AWG26446.1 hypothetical protein FK004_15045 [Flavobacterium kingsejongi]
MFGLKFVPKLKRSKQHGTVENLAPETMPYIAIGIAGYLDVITYKTISTPVATPRRKKHRKNQYNDANI